MRKMNLFEKSLDEIEDAQRDATIMLEARKTLVKLAKFIQKAGGGISEEELSNFTVADLAVCAAHNKFSIELFSTLPRTKSPKNPNPSRFQPRGDWSEDDYETSEDSGPHPPGTK